jgi:hypothetical protein
MEALNGVVENLRQIVLVGAEASPAVDATRVAELLWDLASNPTIASEAFGQSCTFDSRLARSLKSGWVLRTGSEGFFRAFPTLCGPSIVSDNLPLWMYTQGPNKVGHLSSA